jgi:ABC-type multidrug transport system ATPase subunit
MTKQAGSLSGGNKRKLSVAIAIVGNPPIILLDEPSAGMDPKARRFMWDVVANIASNKTSAVILTTHLMEEAEALCTRIGIMVRHRSQADNSNAETKSGGIFKCLGSSQHIKEKYGIGFEVEIKIKIPTRQQLIDIAKEELSSCFLKN